MCACCRVGGLLSGSFNNYARKVRDPQQPLARRYCALISCVRLLAELTGRKFGQTRSGYAARFGFGGLYPATQAQMLGALTAMERDRNLYLAALRAFERKRIRQKMRGQRHPRKADREILFAAVVLLNSETNEE